MLRHREGSDRFGAFGTAAWAGRILATLLISVILSVVYVDTADASDTTADPTGQIATSESTVVEDPGPTSSTTSPPADSDTTSPPADSDTTSPPADADTTSPPADSETTDPNPDPSGSSGATDPATDPGAQPADGTPGTTDGTDPVDVSPPPVESGETPSPPSTNDFPSHGLVAASGTNPSPDPVAVAGNAPVESGPQRIETPSGVGDSSASQPDPSGSTRGRGDDDTVPETAGAAAVLGGLGDAFTSAGGAVSGGSGSGGGAGTTALVTTFIVLLAAVFTRAVRLFSLPPRQVLLIADLERPD